MGLLSSIVSKVKSVASDIKAVYKGGDISASQGKVATGFINAAATIGQSFNPFSNLKPSVNTNIVNNIKEVKTTVKQAKKKTSLFLSYNKTMSNASP